MFVLVQGLIWAQHIIHNNHCDKDKEDNDNLDDDNDDVCKFSFGPRLKIGATYYL